MEVAAPFLHMAGRELTHVDLLLLFVLRCSYLWGVQISCLRHQLSYSVFPTGCMKPMWVHVIMRVSVKKRLNEVISMGDWAFECFKQVRITFSLTSFGKNKKTEYLKKNHKHLGRSVSYNVCDSHCLCLLHLQYSQSGLVGLAFNPYYCQGQRQENTKILSHSGLQSKIRANLWNLWKLGLKNYKRQEAKDGESWGSN